MKIKQFALLALAAGLVGGCALVTPEEVQTINNRISNNEKNIRTLNSQLGIGTSSTGAVPGQAEMWSQFQALRQDFNIVRGQLDELGSSGVNGAELKKLRDKVNALEAAVRQMSSELAIDLPMLEGAPVAATASAAPPAAARPAVAAPTPTAKPVQPQNTDMAKDLYDSGTKAFSDRRYSDAVRIFTDFINTYPSHRLISNAHFWQGEAYYQVKNYSNAILSYQQVIEKYPGSNKLQSAMFKQGVSMYRRGQKDAARVRLNELIRKYPKSTEATRAKQFLESNP